MTILYLCEKPSQARDIARVLKATNKLEHYIEGKNIKITWCVGHLLASAPPEYYEPEITPWHLSKLPIIPQQWHLEIIEKTKPQFNAIKKLLKECDQVVIATDADREGEVIAREILELCRYQGKIERLWLSALDEASIRKALAQLKPGETTQNLYKAGVARQRADWLVGMNMTMAATALFNAGKEGVLSVGRVQTPTLKLVVDRDYAIEQFKPKEYFSVRVAFKAENQFFWTTWKVPETIADLEGRCIDKNMALKLIEKIKNQPARVLHFENLQKEQPPPIGLSLSELQKLSSSRFGLSAKETLDSTQSLYEKHKAITYPRTDCEYLPKSQRAQVSEILKALQLSNLDWDIFIRASNPQLCTPIWNDRKITAHHAIIPTQNPKVNIHEMHEHEYRIYELICCYYLAQFLGNYKYETCRLVIECQNEIFEASVVKPIELGWKQVLKINEEKEVVNAYLPLLTPGDKVIFHEEGIETKHTKPPQRFTEGLLIEAMKQVGKLMTEPDLKKILKENAGIGTEATRASILETLIKRGYLERKGKHVISTAKGRNLIDLLPSALTDAETTAIWEQALESVAAGTLTLEGFMQKQEENIGILVDAIAEKKAQNQNSSSFTQINNCRNQKNLRYR